MTRLLLLAALLAGCDVSHIQDEIAKCHANGYSAKTVALHDVDCCSVLNGDDVCIPARGVTRHRRETGQ